MKASSVLLVLTIFALAGCGGGSDSGQPAAAPADQPAQPAAKNLPPAPPPIAAGKASKEAAETEEATAEETPEPKPERHGQREAAKAGVSGKGNYGPGVLTTPIQAYFRSQERFSFLQVEQAMNLYKGEHGYFPKTEKEFFKQIIEANHIPLPKLPSGCRYIYDAAKAAKMSQYTGDDPPLLVEHPRR